MLLPQRALKEKYKHKFSDEEIKNSIDKIVCEARDLGVVQHIKPKKAKPKKEIPQINAVDPSVSANEVYPSDS
jgi:hypothetical protein